MRRILALIFCLTLFAIPVLSDVTMTVNTQSNGRYGLREQANEGRGFMTAEVLFDSAYETGGETITLTSYFSTVEAVYLTIEDTATYSVSWDETNSKIRVWYTATTSATTTPTHTITDLTHYHLMTSTLAAVSVSTDSCAYPVDCEMPVMIWASTADTLTVPAFLTPVYDGDSVATGEVEVEHSTSYLKFAAADGVTQCKILYLATETESNTCSITSAAPGHTHTGTSTVTEVTPGTDLSAFRVQIHVIGKREP